MIVKLGRFEERVEAKRLGRVAGGKAEPAASIAEALTNPVCVRAEAI